MLLHLIILFYSFLRNPYGSIDSVFKIFYADCNLLHTKFINYVGSYSTLLILSWCQSVCNLIVK